MTTAEATKPCPVCGSLDISEFARARDLEYYTSSDLFSYLACDRCHSVFLDSPPVDRLDKIYPSNYYSYGPTAESTSLVERIKEYLDARLFRKLLGQIPGENLAVLDVGGGAGWLLSAIRKVSSRVKQTHEIDINERARSAAESAGHVYHCCRIEDFSSPQSFDLILMLNLIEHVADPAAVLNAMRKLLSPKGLLLIKTPNVDTLDCLLFRGHNWGGFHCPRHFVLFNKKSIEELGQRSDLHVVSATYTQGAPQWAASILGWMGFKGWIQISSEHPLYQHPLYPWVCAVCAAFDLLRSPLMPTAQMFVVFQRHD
jgi:2-polyprenyl-3-methyl-5-hydroxy-6-metoxy-1,4-benzoquinol methylase